MLRKVPRQPAPALLHVAADLPEELSPPLRRSPSSASPSGTGSTPGRRAGCRAPPPGGPARRPGPRRAGAARPPRPAPDNGWACQRRSAGSSPVSARLSSPYSRIVSSIAKRGTPSVPSIRRTQVSWRAARPRRPEPSSGDSAGPAPRSAAPTASTVSSVQPPTKMARRRNSACSSASSRS